MSVGIHVLGDLLARAVSMLRDDFDIEIVETHHHHKADSPSGTALTLLEIAEKARGGPASRTHGRSGRPGPRPRTEIGLHAVRGGDVIGDHTIHLLGEGERLEIVHRATNRDIFARGALRAARWLPGRPAGLYGMRDLLG
jgi:4-hydroxy-tetrahydrodipicolinate reductase